MKFITRGRLTALAGAVVFSLPLAAVAFAQQAPPSAPPSAAPMTEAQGAAVYAAGEQRLKEVIEVLNTGDYAAMRAYFDANSVGAPDSSTRATKFAGHVPTFSHILLRHGTSRGLDLLRVTTYPARGAVVGIVRNRATGDEEHLALMVEPQPPHRITGVPGIPAADVATFDLQRAASVAVTEEERLQEIGSYLKRMGEAEVFSGAVIIARDGQPILAQAYGHADRDKSIPNTLDTPFLLASVNKLFTGLAIGQLVEQGKLSYEDPLAKFLPAFPDSQSAQRIKIKHLLSHTSGLGDYLGSKAYAEARDRMPTVTVQALVDIFERKPPAFEPGTKWAYSNVGYELLGRIIETVTGQDYYEYMQKQVFAPAGATSASFPALPKNGVAVVPMAYPYAIAWDSENQRVYLKNQLGVLTRRGSPAGGSIVSARDLLKLLNAMHAGRIVTPETFRLHSSAKPELGSPNYGYGFIAGQRFGGRLLIGHNGRAPGSCNELGQLSDTPYTIIVLSNVDKSPTDRVCAQVTERILQVLRPTT